MTTRLAWQAPPALLVLSVFACLALHLGRVSLPPEEPPALSLPAVSGGWVELGEGFSVPGVHQISDGSVLGDVIKLTDRLPAYFEAGILPQAEILNSGERVDILFMDKKGAIFQRGWMTAQARMTLGIPLHPERMGPGDWLALPGIGPSLAERIERDRQDNGDFGSLDGLQRVPGIGPARIKSWRVFF